MNKTLDAAVYYATKFKWSIIPLKMDKRPYISSWLQYQKKQATISQIKEWWNKWPNAMIGIVTGKASNLSVVDIDTQFGKKTVMDMLPDDFVCPTAMTPRGGLHLYFQFNSKLKNAVSILPGIDIRSEGGYVVCPPSISYDVPYIWSPGRTPDKLKIPEIPENLLDAITKGVSPIQFIEQAPKEFLTKGNRDNDLFHAAHCMVKGGLEPKYIFELLTRIAKTCSPPFPPKEVAIKVKSALERSLRKDRNLAQEVEEYVVDSTGVFNITNLCKILQITTFADRKNVSVILFRLVENGTIERAGRYDGTYRKIERSCIELPINPRVPKPLKLSFAFELEKLVNIYKRSIIVIAGSPNAGKTAFVLDFIKRNMEHFPINYFSNEMGDEEFNGRLKLHEDIEPDKWNFKAYERVANFSDVIKKDEFNIIDYIPISEEFWKVAGELNRIYDKLGTGVALVALQKDPGKLYGRGASFGEEIARLYLSLNHNRLIIVKAKAWKNKNNNQMNKSKGFRLVGGWKFIPDKDWSYIERT